MSELWMTMNSADEPEVKPVEWSVCSDDQPVRPAFFPKDAEPNHPSLPPNSSPSAQNQDPPSNPPQAEPAEEPEPEEDPLAELRQEMEHQLSVLGDTLKSLIQSGQQAFQQTTAETVELALLLAEELAAGAIEADPKRIADLMCEAISLTGDESFIKIRINPELHDALLAAGHLDEIADQDELHIKRDPGLEPLGCIVERGHLSVDTQVVSRLKQLRYRLKTEFGIES